jgi:hypothetical protein
LEANDPDRLPAGGRDQILITLGNPDKYRDGDKNEQNNSVFWTKEWKERK